LVSAPQENEGPPPTAPTPLGGLCSDRQMFAVTTQSLRLLWATGARPSCCKRAHCQGSVPPGWAKRRGRALQPPVQQLSTGFRIYLLL